MSWEQRNHDFSTAQVDAQAAYIEAEREVERLQAENEKLRELVRELWNCALQYHRFDVYRHEIGVDGCGIGCTANGEGCCACKLEQRMRELGVEV